MQELSNSGVDLAVAMPRAPAPASAERNSSWLRISRTEAISSLRIRASEDAQIANLPIAFSRPCLPMLHSSR